jgi:hypothetical protein
LSSLISDALPRPIPLGNSAVTSGSVSDSLMISKIFCSSQSPIIFCFDQHFHYSSFILKIIHLFSSNYTLVVKCHL